MEIVVEILHFQYALKSYIPDLIVEKAVNLNQICQFFIKNGNSSRNTTFSICIEIIYS